MADIGRVRVVDLLSTGALAVGDGYRAKNNELGSHGLPFCRAGNVQQGFDFAEADRFPESNLGRVGEKVSRPGDVVFTSKGTVGRFARVRPETERFVYSPQLCYWRSLDSSVVDPDYLYYWMSGPGFRGQFKAVAGQTDMAEYVSLRDQRAMWVDLPDIATQRLIGRILGALDDKIELNRRHAERLDRTARAIFHGWFIANPAAASWPVTSAADLFDVNPPRPLLRTAPAPYLDMANMPTSGPSALAVTTRIPGSGARFENGDTLLARITPCLENGKTALVDFLPPGERGWGSTEYIVLRPRVPLPEAFAYCLARQPDFVSYAVARMNGSSGRQRVSAAAIGEFEMRTPPPELATRFGRVVGPMFARITVTAAESRTLAQMRDALLPRLLSGSREVAA